MNWSITARTFLPMAPAVMILLLRRLQANHCETGNEFQLCIGDYDRTTAVQVDPVIHPGIGRTLWWPLLPAALVSLLVATADYKFANTARLASSYFQERFQTDPGTVWFQGHWGFQYYMEQWRAKPVDKNERRIVSSDLVIIPVNNTNISWTPPATPGRTEQVNFPQSWLATMSPEMGAGFYSNTWGPLPWVLARIPPEPYVVFRVK